MLYGDKPEDLGLIDLNPTEMMFWMYCPIKVPYGQICLPDNLYQFRVIVEKVLKDEYMGSSYMYLTAKTLWVSGDYIGNRPGWHSDGFGTDDLNYIWSDRAPTEFLYTGNKFTLSTDCDISMSEMEELAKGYVPITYKDKHLLKLTPSVIHRCPVGFSPGMRTFVKVSISKNPYDLEGNSINHKLGQIFDLKPRQEKRNHPTFN